MYSINHFFMVWIPEGKNASDIDPALKTLKRGLPYMALEGG